MIAKETLLDIWKDTAQLKEIDPDRTLFDLGMDSIKVIDISESIFKLSGIRLEWEEFNITSSLNEVYDLLKVKAA
ncbi:acyl carrier protein [Erwinia sp. DT-104]|uniref:acyl carrier protein n=1 Tax=unclassified Erwinia TaxID=2622719 RepID=UPI000E8B324F|nr:acyl carrier protein [Erwinia sp.]HBV38511.1 phosphopantetheine-binding protein [Erwinia sp.]